MKNFGLLADFDTVDQTDQFLSVPSFKGVGLSLVMIYNGLGIVIDITSLSQAALNSKVLFAFICNV